MENLLVPEKQGCTNILLIDYFVKDTSVLIDSTNATTLPILYSYLGSKPQLLEIVRAKCTTIDRIGILFTHGNANLFLDKKHFFVQENVDFMVSIIKEFDVKQMDFLACETLNYPAWDRYYEKLRQETGIRIGASNNKTGNLPFASDWMMENTGENIELVYFTKEVELYKYLLDQEDLEHKIDENVIVK